MADKVTHFSLDPFFRCNFDLVRNINPNGVYPGCVAGYVRPEAYVMICYPNKKVEPSIHAGSQKSAMCS